MPLVVTDLFLKPTGDVKPEATVPDSCIGAAEYIIQAIAANTLKLSRKPTAVAATFGNGFTINISNDDIMEKSASTHLTDYAFAGLPSIGQGVILLNKTTNDLPYNMHLGAVVGVDGTHVLISNMFEVPSPHTDWKTLKVETITSAADFATKTFGKLASSYAAGLLTST